MVIAGWSIKGGSGTTVVCTALAVSLSRPGQPGVIVDLGGETSGDVGSLLGRSVQPRAGLTDWLQSDETVSPDALNRLLNDGSGPHLLSVGGRRSEWSHRSELNQQPRHGEQSTLTNDKTGRLQTGLRSLADTYGFVVVDLGSSDDPLAEAVCRVADASLLVLRPCSLSVRAAVHSPRRVFGAALIGEGSRSLVRNDIEGLLGVPVLTHIRTHPAIADAVDNARFAKGVPRELRRSLRPLIGALTGQRSIA